MSKDGTKLPPAVAKPGKIALRVQGAMSAATYHAGMATRSTSVNRMCLTQGESMSRPRAVSAGSDRETRAATRAGYRAQSSSERGGFAPHDVRENPAFEVDADEQEAEQHGIALGTGDQTGEVFNQDEGGPSNPRVPENLGTFLLQLNAGIQSHRSETDLTAREPDVYNRDIVYPLTVFRF